MKTGKITFNADEKIRWQHYAKSVDFYLAVFDFDSRLKNMERFEDVNLIDITAVRSLLRQCMEDQGVSIETWRSLT